MIYIESRHATNPQPWYHGETFLSYLNTEKKNNNKTETFKKNWIEKWRFDSKAKQWNILGNQRLSMELFSVETKRKFGEIKN